ncbi:hypothetical protein PIB30_074876 [Stylosanthes scabra]|uniref:Uncharacterized protein n=1 Tax=Stylosanthes scabra TaxID=79078 RepID=A0ABU6SQV1_9FABA|nr:hypothetical protein [Stylosanthes scabra]
MGEEFEAAICGDNYWWSSSSTNSLFPFMTCSVAAAANDSASCWQVSDFNKGPTTRSSSHEQQEQDTNNKCSNNESSSRSAASGSIFMDSTLQMMAYGLSSNSPSSTCWNNNNNPSISGCNGRSENNFQSSIMLEEETGLDCSVNCGFQIGSSSSSTNTTYGCPSSTMIHEGGLFDPTDSLSSSLFTPPDELSPTWKSQGFALKAEYGKSLGKL